MPLPSNFAALALHSSIKEGDGFLFLTTGASGYLNLMIQGATGSAVSLLNVTSGYTTSKSIWVDGTYGSDTYGQRGRADYPYRTIGSAKTNSIIGDTIFVWPGNYTGDNLLKDGVNYYFYGGANVNLTSGATGAMFSTNGFGGAYETKVLGYGNFYSSYGTGPYNNIVQSTAPVRFIFEFNQIDSSEVNGAPVIYHSGDGLLSLSTLSHNNQIYAYSKKCVVSSGGQIIVNNAYIESSSSANIEGEVYLNNCIVANPVVTSYAYKFHTSGSVDPIYIEKSINSSIIGLTSFENKRGSMPIIFDGMSISGGLDVSGKVMISNSMIKSDPTMTRNGLVKISGTAPLFSNCQLDASNNTFSLYSTVTGSGAILGTVITNKQVGNVGLKYGNISYYSTFSL